MSVLFYGKNAGADRRFFSFCAQRASPVKQGIFFSPPFCDKKNTKNKKWERLCT